MTSITEVQSTLIGAPIGTVLQVDNCISGLQLFICEFSPILLRWLNGYWCDRTFIVCLLSPVAIVNVFCVLIISISKFFDSDRIGMIIMMHGKVVYIEVVVVVMMRCIRHCSS